MPVEQLSNSMQADVAVVGGGPAGLLAALEARGHRADVLLIDEKAEPGGQLFKQIHKFFGSEAHRAGHRGVKIGRDLLAELDAAGVRVLLNTAVWGLFPKHWIGVASGTTGGSVQAKKVILATGASERGLSFPGWTLPGVMGAGAVQTLTNYHRVLPGRRAIVVGAGNVGLIVAYQMAQAGIDVLAVVEAGPEIGGYEVHAAKLRRMGIPVLTRHSIARAEGQANVSAAVLHELDENWQAVPGSELRHEIDLIALAVGLSPAIELAASAGCALLYDAVLGGHMPEHDRQMATSVPGVYVAGDLAGIEEASTAMEEGQLAGLAAAEALGLVDHAMAGERRGEIEHDLAALRLGPFGERRAEAKEKLLGKRELASLGSVSRPSRRRGQETTADFTPAPMTDRPYVAIECPQEIPCNPCETACPSGAITVGEPIIRLPAFDAGKCTACGMCVAACPGLAVFLIDPTLNDREGTVSLPYEFLPLPEVGQEVTALDRLGKDVGMGRVEQVKNPKAYDCTPVVTVAVPKALLQAVRHIRW